ncbi:hypothetical protein BH23BAC1_BH23BAC1_25300 [soil metagenome]
MTTFRPPPRPPLRPLPSRGRLGQRQGQRLPRNTPARREAFERREHERIEAAFRRFDDMVARNQKWLEHWAKEGSEPKTPAQRAFRILVKTLELWDEVSSSWDMTHSELESITQRRLNIDSGVLGSSSSKVVFDRQLIAAWRHLNHIDAEMLRRLTEWQKRMAKWEQWSDRVMLNATNIINLLLDLAVLLFDAMAIASDLRTQLSQVHMEIFRLRLQLRLQLPYRLQGLGQSSIREAY